MTDTNGRQPRNIIKSHGPETRRNEVDYKKAVEYWSSQPPTANGMLGGYDTPRVRRLDISHSSLFLSQLISSGHIQLSKRALDCGAGIGRVTKDLLSKFADEVDLVEPVGVFCDKLRDDEAITGTIYEIGLEDFKAEKEYEIIWNQWCLGQLSDPDLISYLTRIKGHGKMVFVKENVASVDTFDEVDNSWTRSQGTFLRIFRESGLKVLKGSWQHGFPKELYPVKLWALH